MSTPEDKLVDLMAELERSVAEAKATRKRHMALRRPAVGTHVRLTFAPGDGYSGETVTATVTEHYPDAIDVRFHDDNPDTGTGGEFTLFDSERASGRIGFEVITDA